MWTASEKKLLKSLSSPSKVQNYLDSLAYDSDYGGKSPRRTMKEKRAHCFGGAVFAVAALEFHGVPAWLVNMNAVNDDGHVLCVFKRNGKWGAIAKSNFTTLRFREPVYGSLRELVMSYFDFYFNTAGQKTLREYSEPLSLKRFSGWQTDMELLNEVDSALDDMNHHKVISSARGLSKVSDSLIEAGLVGSNPDGLFKPK